MSAETQESMAEMSAITQETLSVSGILLSKVFERRSDEIERYRRANERLAALVRQQMTGQGFFAWCRRSSASRRPSSTWSRD